MRQALEEARARQGLARSTYFPKLGIAGGADTQIKSNVSENTAIGYLYGDYNLFSGFGDSYRTQIAALEAEKGSWAKTGLDRHPRRSYKPSILKKPFPVGRFFPLDHL